MSKSILVIDTPSVCADCPASKLVVVDHAPHFMCGVTGKLVPHEILVSGFREGLCPAKPMPTKYDWSHIDTTGVDPNSNDFDVGSVRGWNECIDEILGEKE